MSSAQSCVLYYANVHLRSPGLLTIALGIGLSSAVFNLVHSVLLRPLPYGDSERLVRVYTALDKEKGEERNASLLDIEDYNRRSQLLKNFGVWTVFDSQIEGDGITQAVNNLPVELAGASGR
jgi:hypothetical protein